MGIFLSLIKRTYPEGATRLLFRLRILRVGIMGVKLDLLDGLDDLELEQDLLLGVRNKDGELIPSRPFEIQTNESIAIL